MNKKSSKIPIAIFLFVILVSVAVGLYFNPTDWVCKTIPLPIPKCKSPGCNNFKTNDDGTCSTTECVSAYLYDSTINQCVQRQQFVGYPGYYHGDGSHVNINTGETIVGNDNTAAKLVETTLDECKSTCHNIDNCKSFDIKLTKPITCWMKNTDALPNMTYELTYNVEDYDYYRYLKLGLCDDGGWGVCSEDS